jgi:hypothetical protein
MLSENPSYVKLEENPSAEPSVEEKNPTEELHDEHEQYRIKDPEEIKEPQQSQEEAPLVETEQPEPTIPDSTTETTANKCMMGCSIM